MDSFSMRPAPHGHHGLTTVLARVPLQLRLGAQWLLMWLVVMGAARLAFHLWFGRTESAEGLGAALWLGLRFDLRLALWCVVPVLLLGCWDVASPWSMRPGVRRAWRVVISVAAFLLALVYAVDAGHYSYLTQRINATVFNYAKDAGTSAGMVWSSYPVLWILAGLLLFAWLFGWLSSLLLQRGLMAVRVPPQPPRWKRGLRHTLWTLATIFLVVLGIHGKWSQYPLRWSDAHELPGTGYQAALALNPVLNLYDTRNFMRDNPDVAAVRRHYPRMAAFLGVDKPDVHTLDFSRHVEPKPQALPRRLNVVVVILESYSGYKSSVFGNPLDPSPEIARLAPQGVLFRRLFSAHPGTARGVFASMTGIPDVQLGDTASRDQQAVNQNLILNAFADHSKWYFIGGSTTWGNVRGFLRRSAPGLSIVEEGQFQAPVLDVWGLSDHDLFKEAIRHLQTGVQKDPRPFFAVIQTAANHRPYTIPDADVGPGKFALREATPEQLAAAGFTSLAEFNGYRYLDWSVGRFFEMARRQPWFDDTVFVLYGDHGITGQAGANMPAYFNPLRLTTGHNMLLLYAPKWLKSRELDFPANQVDIMPTVAGLFDRPYLNTTLGRDLLDSRFDASRMVFGIEHSEGPLLWLLTPDRHVSIHADGSGPRARLLQPDGSLKDGDPARDADLQQLALGWYETARYMTRNNPLRAGEAR